MEATTIDEVIARLEAIIADAVKTGNRAGYFAALYLKVTTSVKEGIAKGAFEDGARMERLDVLFANRYLAAYDQWTAKQPLTGSWRVAFETARKRTPLVLQHLLLGMNAHINLDLGIAAVQTMKGQDLDAIHKDFDSINAVIAALTYEVMGSLNRVSPLLSLMGFHATNYNSILIQFSIGNARDGAWCFADELSRKTGAGYNSCISARDTNITKLAESLVHAKGLLLVTLFVIYLFEWKRPSRVIKALSGFRKEYLKVSQLNGTAERK